MPEQDTEKIKRLNHYFNVEKNKSTMKPKIISIFIVIFLSLTFGGCNKSLGDAIVGRWIPEQGSTEVFMEFFEDGTLLMNSGSHKQQTATWSQAGDNRIKTQSTVGNESEIVVHENIRIEGDRMTISFEGGDVIMVRSK